MSDLPLHPNEKSLNYDLVIAYACRNCCNYKLKVSNDSARIAKQVDLLKILSVSACYHSVLKQLLDLCWSYCKGGHRAHSRINCRINLSEDAPGGYFWGIGKTIFEYKNMF